MDEKIEDLSQEARVGWYRYWTEEHEWSDRAAKALSRFEICENCQGHGSKANPAFDGMTSRDLDEAYGDDWDSRDEFLTEYTTRGGMYDVSCERCGGTGKVLVPDFSKWHLMKGAGGEDRELQEILQEIWEWEESIHEMRAIERMERMAEGTWY